MVEKIKFKEYLKTGEDLVWNLEIFLTCERICLVKEAWYWYFRNSNSATHKSNQNMYDIWINQLNEIEKLIDFKDDEVFVSLFHGYR